jgi:cytochrome P450
MEPMIRSTIDRLLDAIDTSASFDFVSAFTFPLPATTIFSFVGIPERDWRKSRSGAANYSPGHYWESRLAGERQAVPLVGCLGA